MMMLQRLLLPLLALLLPALVVSSSTNEKSWTLYHAWKGHDFTKRGKISLKLVDTVPTLTIDNFHDEKSIPPLDDLYQLKLVQDGTKNVYTLTSVPACQVHRANFRDELTLTLNNQASVISMAYVPLVSPLAPPCSEFQIDDDAKKSFSSKVHFELATPGMALPAVLPAATKPPAGLAFLKQKSGTANPLDPNANKEQEPITSPQGFVKRYWYILLPLFIMSMTSGAAPEEEEKGQQGQGGGAGTHPSQGGASGSGQATASAPVAAAAPTSGGGGGTRRRGKRG